MFVTLVYGCSCSRYLILQHIATYCNTLHATRCNTLQHTTTHCNALKHSAACATAHSSEDAASEGTSHGVQLKNYSCRTLQHSVLQVQLQKLAVFFDIHCVQLQTQQLQCVAVCCSVLQCVSVCCSVLQCVAGCCSVLQCVAVCCSVLQCATGCCSVLQCVTVCCSVLQGVAGCCSALQCVAVCCSVLQRVAVCCSVLQCVAVCFSVLQLHTQPAAEAAKMSQIPARSKMYDGKMTLDLSFENCGLHISLQLLKTSKFSKFSLQRILPSKQKCKADI